MTTKLSLYQTQAILPIATRGAGRLEIPVYAECDTIVMTVFVSEVDPGASLTIDISESVVGADEGEVYSLGGTGEISEVGSKRFSVRGFLITPVFTVTIAGGSARFGVVVAGKQNIPSTPNNTVDFSKIFTDGATVLLDDVGNVISS